MLFLAHPNFLIVTAKNYINTATSDFLTQIFFNLKNDTNFSYVTLFCKFSGEIRSESYEN